MSSKNNMIKIRPIKTEKDYEQALKRIDEIFDSEEGTLEFDELDILATIVEKYEDEHSPILPPDPIEAIKFCMEQMGISKNDLARIIGANRASEILNKKRGLS